MSGVIPHVPFFQPMPNEPHFQIAFRPGWALAFSFVPFAKPETQEKGKDEESEAIVKMDIHVHLLFEQSPHGLFTFLIEGYVGFENKRKGTIRTTWSGSSPLPAQTHSDLAGFHLETGDFFAGLVEHRHFANEGCQMPPLSCRGAA